MSSIEKRPQQAVDESNEKAKLYSRWLQNGALATSTALLALTGLNTQNVSAGGETYTSYCETAVTSMVPFEDARKYWAMGSVEIPDVKILMCYGEARIDYTPDWKHVLRFIPGISGGVDKLQEGKDKLESLGCPVIKERRSEWSGISTRSTVVSVKYTEECDENFKPRIHSLDASQN